MAGGDAATLVHLVRHGVHDLVGLVLTGRMPGVSLSGDGRREAAGVAIRLGSEPITAVYASPLERAQETAAPIAAAHGLTVTTCDALNDIAFGAWTGRAFTELTGEPDWQRWNRERASARPPGGEPMASVTERMKGALEEWRAAHPGGTIAAVSHADVIKAAVCGVLGLSVDRHASFDVDPASVTTLVLWNGGGKLARLNERAPAACEPSA